MQRVRMKELAKPFWKKKRFKLGIPLLLLVILGFVGYQVGMSVASDKVVKEIATQIPEKDVQKLLNEPTIQQVIEDEVGADKKQEILNKYSVNTLSNPKAGKESGTAAVINKDGQKETATTDSSKDTTKLKFDSKEEATKFLLSKFTMSELMGFADKVNGGATPEEKSEIKETVMQRLTPEEYDALKVYAILELSKS